MAVLRVNEPVDVWGGPFRTALVTASTNGAAQHPIKKHKQSDSQGLLCSAYNHYQGRTNPAFSKPCLAKNLALYRMGKRPHKQNRPKIQKNTENPIFFGIFYVFWPILRVSEFSYPVGGQVFPKPCLFLSDTRHFRRFRRLQWVECKFVIFAVFVKTAPFWQGTKRRFTKSTVCATPTVNHHRQRQ